jgi:hypothetical protein
MAEQAKTPFEGLKRTTNNRASVIPDVSKAFEGIGTLVAWQVGVVSPGFLGLLWNAVTLAQHTHLPQMLFLVLFDVAELAFLIALIGSIVLYNFASEVALKLSMVNVINKDVSAILAEAEEPGAITRQLVERLKEQLDRHDDLVAHFALGHRPNRWVTFFAKAHGVSRVVGYVLVAAIIVAIKP